MSDDDPATTTNLGSGLSALVLLVVALLVMLLSSNHNLGFICSNRLGANGASLRIVDLKKIVSKFKSWHVNLLQK